VIVVENSLLRDMEPPICQPDALSREACCLQGSLVRVVTERLPSLVQSTDSTTICYYSFTWTPVIQTRSSLRSTKKDYRALGMVLKDFSAQTDFSAVLPGKGKV